MRTAPEMDARQGNPGRRARARGRSRHAAADRHEGHTRSRRARRAPPSSWSMARRRTLGPGSSGRAPPSSSPGKRRRFAPGGRRRARSACRGNWAASSNSRTGATGHHARATRRPMRSRPCRTARRSASSSAPPREPETRTDLQRRRHSARHRSIGRRDPDHVTSRSSGTARNRAGARQDLQRGGRRRLRYRRGD